MAATKRRLACGNPFGLAGAHGVLRPLASLRQPASELRSPACGNPFGLAGAHGVLRPAASNRFFSVRAVELPDACSLLGTLDHSPEELHFLEGEFAEGELAFVGLGRIGG